MSIFGRNIPPPAPLEPMWSTTLTSPERGTLTLLRGGGFVLGCPADTWEAVRSEVNDLTRAWMDSGGGLTLPFPVDVDDQREGDSK
jgi:hypothetical protein